jgi:ketosteroid isomerase-like protein
MSQENVEAVHQLFAYWERGEWQASAELFDPDFEAVFSATAFPDPGSYRGARRTLDAWRRWLEAWEEFSLELEEAIGVGERVVALNRLRGRGRRAVSPLTARLGASLTSITATSPEWSFATGSKPSKPPGCGSRRGEPSLRASSGWQLHEKGREGQP